MHKTTWDRATQGKMANTKAVRARRFGKEQNSSRTGMTSLLKVCGAILNIVFGRVLLSLRLLCRADDYVSNLECAALRAMTAYERESAVILFGIFMQLLEFCGAIQNFDYCSLDLFRYDRCKKGLCLYQNHLRIISFKSTSNNGGTPIVWRRNFVFMAYTECN